VRVRRAGREAVLIEVDPGEAPGWYAELRRWRESGRLAAAEIVPGATTILVDGLSDAARFADLLRAAPPPPPPPRAVEREVTIPAVYDGPDLLDVARQWNTTADDVVRIHCSTVFTVEFCGFAPGFAYLTGLPPELRVPRLRSPRPRVPAGSVGLAEAYTAVYPGESPGGWQLIGRTEQRLFDVTGDPPALLAPGTTVRFRALDPGGRA